MTEPSNYQHAFGVFLMVLIAMASGCQDRNKPPRHNKSFTQYSLSTMLSNRLKIPVSKVSNQQIERVLQNMVDSQLFRFDGMLSIPVSVQKSLGSIGLYNPQTNEIKISTGHAREGYSLDWCGSSKVDTLVMLPPQRSERNPIFRTPEG